MIMPCSECRSPLGRSSIEWGHFDTHGDNRFPSIIDTRLTSEGDQRLAVRAGWRDQIIAVPIGSLHILHCPGEVRVGAVEQRDQYACVEDQRSHSSRNSSISPER